MKRFAVFSSIIALMVTVSIAWIGSGSPFRDIQFYRFVGGEDISHLFYIDSCDEDGICDLNPEHERVLHFSLGDDYPSHIQGRGRNPIAMLRSAGLSIIPQPGYVAAAMKWCTSGEIINELRHDATHYIVPLPDDPLSTARCLQNQLLRPFSLYVADPIGGDRDWEPFLPLVDDEYQENST